MIAGGEGVAVVLPALEFGVSEVIRVLEEQPEGLGEPVVLLDKGLVVDLFQEGRACFVLGRGGDEERAGFEVEALLVGQHVVPDPAAAAEGFLEQLLLLGRGVDADF